MVWAWAIRAWSPDRRASLHAPAASLSAAAAATAGSPHAARAAARAAAPAAAPPRSSRAPGLARGRAVRVSLNQTMVDETATLPAGAEVAFFPPVTGG